MGQPSKEAKKRWLDANQHKRPTINRNWKLRRFYGITPDEYDEMLFQQDDKCPICKQEFVREPKNNPLYPHLDHEHDSGWVRGILCNRCNFAIGLFEEDIVRIQESVEYLISNVPPPEFNIVLARDRLKKKSTGNRTPRTCEQKELLRNLRTGVPAWNSGKSWGEETRIKMSIAAKKRWENATEEQLAPYREAGKKLASSYKVKDTRWEGN